MITHISNGTISASIDSFGAQLTSLSAHNKEYGRAIHNGGLVRRLFCFLLSEHFVMTRHILLLAK